MRETPKFWIGCFVFSSFFLFLISGCVVLEPANKPPPGKRPAYVPSPRPKRPVGHGPPPHAKAHGYRAKHRYRYYPAVGVYFDVNRRIFFYIAGATWKAAADLPGRLKVRLGDFVSLELATDRPYDYYDRHRKKYPPGRYKKRHKEKKRPKKWKY